MTHRARSCCLQALAICLAALPCLAQTHGSPGGRIEIAVPEATQAGDWDGTWFYKSAQMKMVLWMRTQKGKTELKLRYESGQRPLDFETDWKGDATYYTAERPGSFQIHLTRSDPNRMEGTWFWETPLGTAVKIEKGTFTIFRTYDGRFLAFKFNDYELNSVHQGKPYTSSMPPVWTFQKASRRQALWDELPF